MSTPFPCPWMIAFLPRLATVLLSVGFFPTASAFAQTSRPIGAAKASSRQAAAPAFAPTSRQAAAPAFAPTSRQAAAPAFAPTSRQAAASEKMYVVERERQQIAVLQADRYVRSIGGLGKLHHATVKIWRGRAYVISRDGLLSQIDLQTDRVIRQARVGKSSIGLTFVGSWIAVANYEPSTVVFVNEDLSIQKTLDTGSRNVGIKNFQDLLVFGLMDKNEIWVVDTQKDFRIVHRVVNAGLLPYDALIQGSLYLCAFFRERHIGLLDLQTKAYRRVLLPAGKSGIPSKIPHFGMWGLTKEGAYLPLAGSKQLLLLDLQTFQVKAQIPLQGLPVFAVVSPDGRWLAVTYSGPHEDQLTLISTASRRILRHLPLGKRLMHLRFSKDSQRLFVSSFFEHRVHAFQIDPWHRAASIPVASPSGLFGSTP